MPSLLSPSRIVEEALLARNAASAAFFAHEAEPLAAACREMAERFLRGGRLLAFGRGACATDAQHVAVEFVHPVIVGKRALPALDLSIAFPEWVPALVTGEDIVMGFAGPAGDPEVDAALDAAGARGAQTFALCGPAGDYAPPIPSSDPFVHQELVEILYHTLWETVHVFFEHRERGHEVGAAGFLYPFLGAAKQEMGGIAAQVADSIRAKAADDEALRAAVAAEQAGAIVAAAAAIHERVARGGRVLTFGNGGSATDANDFALDCVAPPSGWHPVPALSLSLEPASLSAIANDVGIELVFLRQLVAHGGSADIAFAISTSGGSANIIVALEEARRRGMLTVALLGYDGGEIVRRGLADHALVVRSDYIPRIQEVQASIYHVLRGALEALANG